MQFLETHSGALLILLLTMLVLFSLLVLVPQLLRAKHHATELLHAEHMKALERGQKLEPIDERSRLAGRIASIVPMVVICATATVTCFLVAFQSEHAFAVALTSWCVAGVVSLAAITGGVALMGRLAQLHAGLPDDDKET
jgi:hypothetical protein